MARARATPPRNSAPARSQIRYNQRMGKKKTRARSERREMERRLRKQVRDREKLAALSPGGAPERPVRVATVAVIEGRAKAEPCPLCDGAVELLDHAAVEREGAALRELTVRCRRCHVSRSRWFAIAPPLAN